MKRISPCISSFRLVVMASLTVFLLSCASARRDEKFYERQEKQQAKLEQKDYDKRVKEHKEMQSKSTLKMMKQSERESRKMNKYKKR